MMNPHGDMDAYRSRFRAMERPNHCDTLVNSINISDREMVRPSGLSLIDELTSTAAAVLGKVMRTMFADDRPPPDAVRPRAGDSDQVVAAR